MQGTCDKGAALKIKGIPESPARDLVLGRIDITAPVLPPLPRKITQLAKNLRALAA